MYKTGSFQPGRQMAHIGLGAGLYSTLGHLVASVNIFRHNLFIFYSCTLLVLHCLA